MPTITLYTNLRKIAGTSEVFIPSKNLGECVLTLIERFPALDGVVLEDGQIKPYFVITINGRAAVGLDVAVGEDDVIAIFPFVAGG